MTPAPILSAVAGDLEPQWPTIPGEAAEALGREVGARVALLNPAPMVDGWSAEHGAYPFVRRCEVSGLPGRVSVVVKTRCPTSDRRSSDGMGREWAALMLLAELGSNAGPRVLARGEGFLVLEDLGRGAAVEDLLVGGAPGAATAALVALARAVGAMHAATHGHQASFYARLVAAGIHPHTDRMTVAEATIAERWATLRELAAAGTGLPETSDAEADIDEMTGWLAEPGPWLALSSGDLAPQNCRVGAEYVRLLDFEHAAFRHVMLDAAQLRLSFCAAPCWGRLPAEVSEAMEFAFRIEFARACPDVLEDRA